MHVLKGLVVLAVAAQASSGNAQSLRADEERGLEKIPCVHDECPALFIDGADYSTVNGVFTPFKSCSDYPYGKGTYDAHWSGYMNKNGARVTWYWKANKSFGGWSVSAGDHHRYYDGLRRNSPTELQLDNWVARTNYAKFPAPTVTCMKGSNVFWKFISSNPTTVWKTTAGSTYSKQQKDMQQVQASIGVSYAGMKASSSYQYQTEQTISSSLSKVSEESCGNPCGTDRALWASAVDAGLGENLIMLPNCGHISCVPLGKRPLCPVEYCGGDDIFEGCQCCTSLEWLDSSYPGTPPPLCPDSTGYKNKGL